MFKKLIFFSLLLVFIVSLTSCGDSIERRNLRDEINQLIDEYPDKTDELEALKQELYDNPNNVYSIAKRVETLRPIYQGIYDGYIIVRIIDLTDEVIVDEDVLYRNNESLLDILIKEYNAEYDDSGTNVMLKRVGQTFIDQNYHLVVYHDNVPISNLKSFPYTYGDTITIRNENFTNLDKTDLLVDKAVYRFLRNKIDNYFSLAPKLDPYVVNALRLLEDNGYDVSVYETAIPSRYMSYYSRKQYDITSPNYVSTLFKDLLIMSALDLDINDVLSRIKEKENTFVNVQNHYALLTYGVSGEEMEDVLRYLNNINAFLPTENDLDVVSLALMAIANYSDYGNYQQIVNKFNTFLSENLSFNSIEANCTSTASAVIALLANGINPRGESYQMNDSNLITTLLQYEKDGSFSWTISSGEDLAFSTPQAWAALVTYKIYRDLQMDRVCLFQHRD